MMHWNNDFEVYFENWKYYLDTKNAYAGIHLLQK